jgi:hypothetical protein
VDFGLATPLTPDQASPSLVDMRYGRVVLVGTLLELVVADSSAPQATLRLPSGEVFSFIGPPLEGIQIDGDEALDLAAYDPDFPVRVRLIVQANDPFVVEEMAVGVFGETTASFYWAINLVR